MSITVVNVSIDECEKRKMWNNIVCAADDAGYDISEYILHDDYYGCDYHTGEWHIYKKSRLPKWLRKSKCFFTYDRDKFTMIYRVNRSNYVNITTLIDKLFGGIQSLSICVVKDFCDGG